MMNFGNSLLSPNVSQNNEVFFHLERDFTWKKVCEVIRPIKDSCSDFRERVLFILKDLVQKKGDQRKFEEESDFLNLRVQLLSKEDKVSIERFGGDLSLESREMLIEHFKKSGLQVIESEAA